ncbi:glycoside hydrolase family 28 protein [candidate division KSB1 bacterium]|nr:glycoside hydrolase family 28 protein [candidate division KSB1 bacterium]
MKWTSIVFSLIWLSFTFHHCATADIRASESGIDSSVSYQPFAMPEPDIPRFPARSFDIRDFGAVGDGKTLNTDAIARTIEACVQAGGGRVVAPAGTWLTGPIYLHSNIELHLRKGALLVFSRDFDDYPLIESIFEGTAQYRCTSPINGVDLQNIAITGDGVIDGSGDAWRPVKRFKMTGQQWQDLIRSGGVVNQTGTIWWPTEAAMRGEDYMADLKKRTVHPTREDVMPARDYLRPVMIRLANCKNVLLDGPTFQNSPAWNIHPLLCEKVIIRNITVRNPWYAQNGDGLDLESCKNVWVYNNVFDVGDDAICLKSGKDEEGRRRGRPTENVVIKDCTVYHGHGGFTIGSEMSGGIRNVLVSHCTFIGTDVGLRFKSARGRGGVVEEIYLHDIRMLDIENEAILFDLFYAGNPSSSHKSGDFSLVSEATPQFRRIYFENIFCRHASSAIVLNGLPELPLKEIKIDSLVMACTSGIRCNEVENLSFSRVNVRCEQSPVFYFIQSRNIRIGPARVSMDNDIWLKVEGEKSKNIRLFVDEQPSISYGKNADHGAVIFERHDAKK